MKSLYYLLIWVFFGAMFAQAQTPCNQNYGSAGNFSVPITYAGDQLNMAAMDLFVEPNTSFTLEELDLTVVTEAFPLEFIYSGIIYEGSLGNNPEPIELAMDGMPSSTDPGKWKITLSLNAPMELDGGNEGLKYWFALAATPFGDDEIAWAASMFMPEGNNEPVYYSGDGGNNWSPQIPGEIFVLETAGNFKGTCKDTDAPPAAEECNQSYGAAGSFSVPITYSDTEQSMAAMDLYVEPNIRFTLNSVDLTVTTDAFPLGFIYSGIIYDGTLGNFFDAVDLTVDGMPSSTDPGLWKITLNLSDPIELEGGSEGQKYWFALAASPLGDDEIGWLLLCLCPTEIMNPFIIPVTAETAGHLRYRGKA